MSQRLHLSQQWAETRLAQVERFILDKIHGHDPSLLTRDEAAEAIADCTAALGVYLADPRAIEKHTASASCWAVLLAQGIAARRPEGWTVDDEIAQRTWDVRLLHTHLLEFRGERFHDESQGSATLVGRGAVRNVPRLQESASRRLRLDALGDDGALKAKASLLHRLLLQAGRPGLPQPILGLERPTVRVFGEAYAARRLREEAIVASWSARALSRTVARAARRGEVSHRAVHASESAVGNQMGAGMLANDASAESTDVAETDTDTEMDTDTEALTAYAETDETSSSHCDDAVWYQAEDVWYQAEDVADAEGGDKGDEEPWIKAMELELCAAMEAEHAPTASATGAASHLEILASTGVAPLPADTSASRQVRYLWRRCVRMVWEMLGCEGMEPGMPCWELCRSDRRRLTFAIA